MGGFTAPMSMLTKSTIRTMAPTTARMSISKGLNCRGETERLVIDKGAVANILETEGEEALRNEQVLGWLVGITG